VDDDDSFGTPHQWGNINGGNRSSPGSTVSGNKQASKQSRAKAEQSKAMHKRAGRFTSDRKNNKFMSFYDYHPAPGVCCSSVAAPCQVRSVGTRADRKIQKKVRNAGAALVSMKIMTARAADEGKDYFEKGEGKKRFLFLKMQSNGSTRGSGTGKADSAAQLPPPQASQVTVWRSQRH
jgi:hypothetical protein